MAENLTPAEQTRFLNMRLSIFRFWENVHYQYRMGLYEENEYSKQKEAWRIVMNLDDATVQVWCSRRLTFSAEYMVDIDGLLDKYQCN